MSECHSCAKMRAEYNRAFAPDTIETLACAHYNGWVVDVTKHSDIDEFLVCMDGRENSFWDDGTWCNTRAEADVEFARRQELMMNDTADGDAPFG